VTNISGSGCERLIPKEELKSNKEIERSIIKTYRKVVWSKFIKGIKEFELVEEGDKIAVGISGGKDSLLLAKLLQELKKHGRVKFELEFIAMNPGYFQANEERLKENCQHLEIPIIYYDSDIFKIVDQVAQAYPCYLCAKMRRGALYAKAQALGCNKLALGHHMDDVIETQLMNLFYAGTTKTMMPRLRSQNFEGLELIRPMYYIKEEAIINFTMNAGLSPMNCGCVVAAKKTSSKRQEMKELIRSLKKMNPDIDKCILNSAHNVNMNCIIGWKKEGVAHSFLDTYKKGGKNV